MYYVTVQFCLFTEVYDDMLFLSVQKKDAGVRDNTMSPVMSSLAGMSVASQMDSSRTASTSHPDLRQPPAVPPQRYGETAASRLAPKPAGQNQRESAAELRPGSDVMNNQRVIEWQMRNQMATDVDNLGPRQQNFESTANATEQRPSYYPMRPQSQLIESEHVMSRPAVSASPLPHSTSVPEITDNTVPYRGQMAANFHEQLSAAGLLPVSTPVYSDDQRYIPRQLQPNVYNQRFAAPVRPPFNQMTDVRPNTSEVTRYPLPGMVPQSVRHPGPNVPSYMPAVHQQPPVSSDSAQYRLSVGATNVSEQRTKNYYPTRPQSELIEPGYVASQPPRNASPLLQSTSMPAITDNVVGNRDRTVSSVQQQAPNAEKSSGTPMYSADHRYRPQQMQPSQQFTASVPPHFNQMANARPQSSELARQPLPGMVPKGMPQPSSSVRSELPRVDQQPTITGAGVQYRPLGGQFGVQDVTSNMTVAPAEVQVAFSAAARPGIPGLRYGVPDIYNQRSALPQDVSYEISAVKNRAVPAGIPSRTDHPASRPYAAHEVCYGPPVPNDNQYVMQNVAGEMPSAAPGVHYDPSNIQDRLPEDVPGSYRDSAKDQSTVKFSQPSGYYESSFNTAGTYSSQETPYGMRSTGVMSNVQYDPSSTGDGWPLPPSPQERYGAQNVRSEISVQSSVNIQPPSSQLSAPHFVNADDGLKPLLPEVRASVPNTVSSVPSLPPGMPTNEIRPRKQPPPVAAKPKFPVSTGVTAKTKEITKDDGKQLKPEKIQQKMLEIQRLELRPYLTASEQTRLQNLRVEVEFDKRLADMSEKREDNSDSEQHRMLPSTVRIPLSFTYC